jgi:hypothetical protein
MEFERSSEDAYSVVEISAAACAGGYGENVPGLGGGSTQALRSL